MNKLQSKEKVGLILEHVARGKLWIIFSNKTYNFVPMVTVLMSSYLKTQFLPH